MKFFSYICSCVALDTGMCDVFIDMVVPLCLLSFFRIFGIANRTTAW